MLRREFLKAAAAWVAVGAGLGEAAKQIGDGSRVRTWDLGKVTLRIGGVEITGMGLDGIGGIVIDDPRKGDAVDMDAALVRLRSRYAERARMGERRLVVFSRVHKDDLPSYGEKS